MYMYSLFISFWGVTTYIFCLHEKQLAIHVHVYNKPVDKLVGGASVVGVLNAMALVLPPADVNSVKNITIYTLRTVVNALYIHMTYLCIKKDF